MAYTSFIRNNNFKFEGQVNSQFKCPFAAHIRKANPRDDLEGGPPPRISNETKRIMRRGIPFGPEVTPAEEASKTTQKGRGLLFVCYQSSISNGFQFLQQSESQRGFRLVL
jgi:deferrochelatase/peroxidase EfeB